MEFEQFSPECRKSGIGRIWDCRARGVCYICCLEHKPIPRAYSIVVVRGISGPKMQVRFLLCSFFIILAAAAELRLLTDFWWLRCGCQ